MNAGKRIPKNGKTERKDGVYPEARFSPSLRGNGPVRLSPYQRSHGAKKNMFLHTMSRSPLLAPCRAARKQPQRRTSLYLCTTRRGQVIFRGGLWNAVGGRLTGEAGDRRTGRMGGEGNDNVLPDSEGGRLPGGPHHATSPSQA